MYVERCQKKILEIEFKMKKSTYLKNGQKLDLEKIHMFIILFYLSGKQIYKKNYCLDNFVKNMKN